MDKEKILEAARANKNRGKEYENKQIDRGGLLSVSIAFLVSVGLFLLEYLTKGTLNCGLLAVGMTAGGVQYLYEGITLKKARTIVIGIIYSAIALLLILAFVGQVVLV